MKQTSLPKEPETVPAGLPWTDRFSRKAFVNIMERFENTGIQVRFPEGTTSHFGPEGSGGAEIHIHRDTFFKRVLLNGEIGFGEGYMDGDWSTPDLPRLLAALIENLEHIPHMSGSHSRKAAFNLLRALNRFAHWRRRNTRSNSRRNISEHYDLSNDFYSLWLDRTLTYSSAWFNGSESLEDAQINKYQRLCEKLCLAPGMRVLEIGCGWGGFSIHAATNFGVEVTAITISQAQFEKACERVKEAGLEDRITVKLCDYRDIQGQFDAIVSIEMLEAVGHKFLPAFFSQCHHLLKESGRVGLQVIICPDSRYEAMRKSVDWIKKYIFPGGQLPSIKALMDSANSTSDLYIHHLESFGLHYAKTLHIWRDGFNKRKDAVMELGFDEVFLRKWNYYLAYCEAAFATRNINVTQMILSRPNNTAFALE
ncbi:MAG: class I SAM-dependent methyltransferase [Puniceicoccaceae bacterium]